MNSGKPRKSRTTTEPVMPASLANRSHPVVSSSPSVDRFPIFITAVGADEAIVSFDKKKLPSTDDARLDCGGVADSAEEARIVEPTLEIAHSSGQTGGHKAAAAAASLTPKSLFGWLLFALPDLEKPAKKAATRKP